MSSLPDAGCTACKEPMRWFVNPLGGKTTDWKAVCGRSACTVWRGEGSIDPSYPIESLGRAIGVAISVKVAI